MGPSGSTTGLHSSVIGCTSAAPAAGWTREGAGGGVWAAAVSASIPMPIKPSAVRADAPQRWRMGFARMSIGTPFLTQVHRLGHFLYESRDRPRVPVPGPLLWEKLLPVG